jgi:hypothetical protein
MVIWGRQIPSYLVRRASVPGGENITVGIHCGRKSSNAALQTAGVPEDRRCAIHGRTGGDTGVTTGEYDEKCFMQTVKDIRGRWGRCRPVMAQLYGSTAVHVWEQLNSRYC